MDRIISFASRVSWLETPQGIDLSVITQAVLASEKLHSEVLSFENKIQFLSRDQRRERDMVSEIFTTDFKQGRRQLLTACCLLLATEAVFYPSMNQLYESKPLLNVLA